MKVMLDVQFEKELERNDVLIYSKGVWTNMSRSTFLAYFTRQIEELSREVSMLKEKTDILEKNVKELRGED